MHVQSYRDRFLSATNEAAELFHITSFGLRDAAREFRWALINQTLLSTHGNVSESARRLRCARTTLQRELQRMRRAKRFVPTRSARRKTEQKDVLQSVS